MFYFFPFVHTAVHVLYLHSAVHHVNCFFTAVCIYLFEMGKPKKKNPAAVALGRKGGQRSRVNLTPQQRTELARKAATARWKGKKGEKD
jgi:hypothetical protein